MSRSGNETKQTRGARLEVARLGSTYGVELKTAGTVRVLAGACIRAMDQRLRSLTHFLTKYQWLLDTYVVVSQCRPIMFTMLFTFYHTYVQATYL